MKIKSFLLFFWITIAIQPPELFGASFTKKNIPKALELQDSIIVISGSLVESAWKSHLQKIRQKENFNTSGNIERYTIQVFGGNRKEAMRIYNELKSFEDITLHFDEPNFKVSVGIFSIKLSAEYALREWRKKYPESFVVKSPF